MASPEVTIQANLEGAEQVEAGFNRIGEAAGRMSSHVASSAQNMSVQMDLFGNKVKDSTNQMEISHRRLALTMAGMISNSVQLGDIMSRMASGQIDVARGALLLAMNFIQLATQIALVTGAEKGRLATTIASTMADVGHTIALKAKAVALAIVHALSGPIGWAILAGAAAAATVGLALATRIPEGAGVYTKASPLKFITGPLAGTTIHEGASINITIYARDGREAGDGVIDALRRAGVIT